MSRALALPAVSLGLWLAVGSLFDSPRPVAANDDALLREHAARSLAAPLTGVREAMQRELAGLPPTLVRAWARVWVHAEDDRLAGEAWRLLAQVGDGSDVEPLRGALAGAGPRAGHAAAEALVALSRRDALGDMPPLPADHTLSSIARTRLARALVGHLRAEFESVGEDVLRLGAGVVPALLEVWATLEASVVRREAAVLLGRVGGDDVRAGLIAYGPEAWMEEPIGFCRAMALLGRGPDMDALDAWIHDELLGDDRRWGRWPRRGGARRGDDRVEFLRMMTALVHPSWAERAAERAMEVLEGPGWLPAARLAAADLMVALGPLDEVAIQSLVEGVSPPFQRMRGGTAPADELAEILRLLERIPQAPALRDALDELARRQELPPAVAVWLRYLLEGKDAPDLRKQAEGLLVTQPINPARQRMGLRLLDRMGMTSEPLLVPLENSPDGTVRALALRGLLAHDFDPTDRERIYRALRDPALDVFLVAAECPQVHLDPEATLRLVDAATLAAGAPARARAGRLLARRWGGGSGFPEDDEALALPLIDPVAPLDTRLVHRAAWRAWVKSAPSER